MFGRLNSHSGSKLVEKVDYRIQDDSRYRSANDNQQIIIDTPMGRVYINDETYLTNVPEIVWESNFVDEPSPKIFLERKVGGQITQQDVDDFQLLLDDLINAEFKSKNQSL